MEAGSSSDDFLREAQRWVPNAHSIQLKLDRNRSLISFIQRETNLFLTQQKFIITQLLPNKNLCFVCCSRISCPTSGAPC